jgi:RNA polymerase sigma-70 factor (ECF subfamily)
MSQGWPRRQSTAGTDFRGGKAVMTDDDALMIRVQSGDPAAFVSLVEKYEGPLIGFFFRNLRDIQLSEDLTQETLLRLHSQSWDYLPLGRFRAWMYRIARNLMIDNVRRQSHDVLIRAVKSRSDQDDALARMVGEVLSPPQRADQRELVQLVDAQLEQLPEEQRLTFVLHHYADLSLPEVADVMETSVSTTKSRLRLAREKLRESLQRLGYSAPDDGTAEDEAENSPKAPSIRPAR